MLDICVIYEHLCDELRVLWAIKRWLFTLYYHTVTTAFGLKSALGTGAAQSKRLIFTARMELMRLVVEGFRGCVKVESENRGQMFLVGTRIGNRESHNAEAVGGAEEV